MAPIGKYAITSLVSLAIGAGFAYRFMPTKIVTKTEVVSHDQRVTHRNIETTKRIEKGPDGKPVTVITRTDRSVDEDKKDSSSHSQTTTSRESPNWAVGGGLLENSGGKRSYYGQIERRLFGEVYAGALGTSDGHFGIGLSLRF